ncbi:MAG: 30S ribosomal protein S25e [Candidatus Bathyarchaeia archaeon]|jgi:ribosomal protein S25
MGGKKKIGLKQMERQQSKEDAAKAKKEKKDKKASSAPKEKKTIISVIPPDAKNDRVVAEVKKMPVLTPYAVSTRYSIKISAAKEFLEQLKQNGDVELVSGNQRIKVYKPCA